jgi:hypothetical protein
LLFSPCQSGTIIAQRGDRSARGDGVTLTIINFIYHYSKEKKIVKVEKRSCLLRKLSDGFFLRSTLDFTPLKKAGPYSEPPVFLKMKL